MDNFLISELFDIIGASVHVMWDMGMDATEAEEKIYNEPLDDCKADWEELLDEIEG